MRRAWCWRVCLSGPPSHPDDHGSFGETGAGPRHASAYGCFWKNFLSFVLMQFALGIWCIISVVLVSGSHCSGRLGIAEEYGNLDFSGDVYFRGVQCFIRQWIHALRQYFGGFGRTSHIFYVAADSNPEVLLGEECPVDASGCSFALRSSHLETWKFFSSFTWLTRVMMGTFFAAQCGIFRPPLRS